MCVVGACVCVCVCVCVCGGCVCVVGEICSVFVVILNTSS